MNLRDGCGGERLLVDEGEGLRQAHAELGGQDLLHLGERKRRHVVLQPRERLGVRLRDDIGPRRQQLPELDEGRPEFLDVACQLLGLGRRLARVRLLLRHELRQAGVLDQVTASVLEQQPGEVLVALQVFWF